MKSKVILSGTLLVLLGSSVAWAGDPWKEKPYTEWTEKEVQKVLKKSPWAKPVKVEFVETVENPLGERRPEVVKLAPNVVKKTRSVRDRATGELHTEVYYEYVYPNKLPKLRRVSRSFVVVWFSAMTIQQAVIRDLQLRDAWSGEKLDELLPSEPEHYVIAVRPPTKYRLATEDVVRKSAYLQPMRSKEKIPPASVGVRFSSSGMRGFYFYFPREVDGKQVFAPDEKKVKFHCCRLSGKTISTTFDLRKMTRDGKPDL